MTEATSEAVESQEMGPTLEKLIQDPSYATIIFRRHTSYTREPKEMGFLTPEGYHQAEESAQRVVSMIPEGAEVNLAHSPSFMLARARGRVANDQRSPLGPSQVHALLEPSRAQFTARVYGKELHRKGFLPTEPTVKVNPDATYELEGIKKDKRLGDILEEGTAVGITNFYRVLKSNEGYGSLNRDFWDDYRKDQLKPAVAHALKEANGWDSLREAKNLEEVVEEKVETRLKNGQESNKKVDVEITHGESEDSFLYSLYKYLQGEGRAEDAEVIERNTETNYNQGFEAHINVQGNLIVTFGNRGGVDVGGINGYKDYLATKSSI